MSLFSLYSCQQSLAPDLSRGCTKHSMESICGQYTYMHLIYVKSNAPYIRRDVGIVVVVILRATNRLDYRKLANKRVNTLLLLSHKTTIYLTITWTLYLTFASALWLRATLLRLLCKSVVTNIHIVAKSPICSHQTQSTFERTCTPQASPKETHWKG